MSQLLSLICSRVIYRWYDHVLGWTSRITSLSESDWTRIWLL